jgi:serine/threonine-protein kinase
VTSTPWRAWRYECLTGDVPFPREGQLAIMTAHVTAPPPRVTAARPDLPIAVDAVLARGMAKDPAARFATCTELIAALAATATGVEPETTRYSPMPRPWSKGFAVVRRRRAGRAY